VAWTGDSRQGAGVDPMVVEATRHRDGRGGGACARHEPDDGRGGGRRGIDVDLAMVGEYPMAVEAWRWPRSELR
jgi:hypothetical protein